VPAGIRWPSSTFSLRPISVSSAPRRAASVSTLVDSWNDAPERNDSDCRLGLRDAEQQRPARRGAGPLGLGRAPCPRASARALASRTIVTRVTRSPTRSSVSPASWMRTRQLRPRCSFFAEDVLVDDLVRQQVRVARVLDADLAEHLAQDELDVLVVDGHALRAVDVLHLVEHVRPQRLFALDPQDVVRDERALGERIARLT
jgi:hypothetical protein